MYMYYRLDSTAESTVCICTAGWIVQQRVLYVYVLQAG